MGFFSSSFFLFGDVYHFLFIKLRTLKSSLVKKILLKPQAFPPVSLGNFRSTNMLLIWLNASMNNKFGVIFDEIAGAHTLKRENAKLSWKEVGIIL